MIKGKFEFFGINKVTGEHEIFEIKDNLILNEMYNKLVELLGGEASSYIDRMQFGTGSLAPAATQQFLQTPITPIKTVTSEIDATDDYTVIFTAYLLVDEGNGFPISEAGLLANDDTLVTRITFTARTKTSSFTFGFRWSITVKSS